MVPHAKVPGFCDPAEYEQGKLIPCAEWEQIEEGDVVVVQRDGGALLEGEVDTRTQDASVFWVWLDEGRGRIAVYADDDTRVWLPEAFALGRS